jgi:hypothetical protein
VRFLANQFDALLRPQIKLTDQVASSQGADESQQNISAPAYGTGEEQQAAIIASYDELVKQLHKAVAASDSLHLSINSVHGVTPVFRYTEVSEFITHERNELCNVWRWQTVLDH